ncbi:sporulation histidine kinase inhibitor Sda [Alteribacillus sp. YIM 98480]
MKEISTSVLSKTYEKAKELALGEDFLNLLKGVLYTQFVPQ